MAIPRVLPVSSAGGNSLAEKVANRQPGSTTDSPLPKGTAVAVSSCARAAPSQLHIAEIKGEPESLSRRRTLALATSGTMLSLAASFMPAQKATASPVSTTRLPLMLLPLNVYLGAIRGARKELDSIRARVELSGASGSPIPFTDIQRSLKSGELASLRGASLGADEYLGEDDLQAWEEQAWDAMPKTEDMWRNTDNDSSIGSGSSSAGRDGEVSGNKLPFGGIGAPTGVNTFNLGGVVNRPNELLCLVFSCFNDPRQPPSTNHLLTYKMLQEGLTMGARGDARITPEGIVAIIDDLDSELDTYLGLAAERQRILGPSSSPTSSSGQSGASYR